MEPAGTGLVPTMTEAKATAEEATSTIQAGSSTYGLVPTRSEPGDGQGSTMFIFVSLDKVHHCLRDHMERVEASREWVLPAGLLVSVGATLLTADFHDVLQVKAAVWQAVFWMAAVVCTVWLIIALRKGVRAPSVRILLRRIESCAYEKQQIPAPSETPTRDGGNGHE